MCCQRKTANKALQRYTIEFISLINEAKKHTQNEIQVASRNWKYFTSTDRMEQAQDHVQETPL
jgi:hypothetical protein